MVYGFDRINRIRIELVRVFVSFFFFGSWPNDVQQPGAFFVQLTCLLLSLPSFVSRTHTRSSNKQQLYVISFIFCCVRTTVTIEYAHSVILFFSVWIVLQPGFNNNPHQNRLLAIAIYEQKYSIQHICAFLTVNSIRFINFLDEQVREATNNKKRKLLMRFHIQIVYYAKMYFRISIALFWVNIKNLFSHID